MSNPKIQIVSACIDSFRNYEVSSNISALLFSFFRDLEHDDRYEYIYDCNTLINHSTKMKLIKNHLDHAKYWF